MAGGAVAVVATLVVIADRLDAIEVVGRLGFIAPPDEVACGGWWNSDVASGGGVGANGCLLVFNDLMFP